LKKLKKRKITLTSAFLNIQIEIQQSPSIEIAFYLKLEPNLFSLRKFKEGVKKKGLY